MSICKHRRNAKRFFAVEQCRHDVIEKLDALLAQRIELM